MTGSALTSSYMAGSPSPTLIGGHGTGGDFDIDVNSGEYRANLLTSKNPVYDLFKAINYANSKSLNNLSDIVIDNNYSNIPAPAWRYKKIIEMNGHSFDVRVSGQVNNAPKGYYNIFQMGFGYLDRFSDFPKTTKFNGGYYQGFFMTGYENNYIITIGVRNDDALNYLKKIFYGF